MTADNADINAIAGQLPAAMPVAVVLQKQKANSKWIDYQWQVTAVVPGAHGNQRSFRQMHEDGENSCYLFTGLRVTLHRDECESYYHNLMSPEPGCFVVVRFDETGQPEPFLITLDFDEAHAYLEGDDAVYAVAIPPELYRWIEAYVLAYYLPVKRKKRKRQDWTESDTGGLEQR